MPKTDYAETLLAAMDTIASQRVSSVSFDQTIKCTIVDNTTAGSGKYKVTYGSVSFDAYVNDSTYKVDDQVYVLVPDGDFKQQKLIIGKYVAEEEKPYIYESPFDQIVDMTGNIITKHVEKGSLTANLYYDQGIQELKSRKTSLKESDYKSQLRELETNLKCCIRLWHKDFSSNPQQGYTRLGLQAEFSSWLENWNVIEGDYGLRLVVKATNVDNPNTTQIYEYYLNVAEMYGNPYKFEGYHTQETAFDITTLDTIMEMELWFYEDSASFYYNSNGKNYLVPYKDEIFGSLLAPNLFVRDPYICLGYSTAEVEDELITLSTTDDLFYEPRMEEDKYLDNKTIHLTWVHMFDDGAGRVDSYEDLDFDEIRWYRYEPGALAADADSGSHWERLYPTNALKSELNPNISWNEEESYWDAIYSQEWIIRDNTTLIKKTDDIVFNEETDQYLYLPAFLATDNITINNKVTIFEAWLVETVSVGNENKRIVDLLKLVQPDYKWNNAINNISTTTNGQLQLKLYVNYAIQFLDAGANGKYKKLFTMILEPDSTQQVEKVKAIVYYDGAVKKSNILEFQNKVDVINQKAIDMVGALEIRCDDNSSGYYLGYDLGGHLWNSADAQTERTLSLHYYPNGRDESETDITDLEFLEWIIPKNNTMLNFIDLEITDETPSDDQYYYIKFSYDKSNIDYKTTVTYKISKKYSRRYANNTVKARFKQYDNTITGIKEFVFGPKGTAGTRSTFDLMFDDSNTTAILNKVGTNDKPNAVKVRALLYDVDGYPVNNITGSIDWTWKRLNGMTDEEYNSMDAFTITKDSLDIGLIELKLDKAINLWQNKYILQATLTGWEDVALTAYLPIPFKSSEDYSHIEGTIDISYNSNGVPYETDVGDANNFQGYYYLYTKVVNDNKQAVDGLTWVRYPLVDENDKQAYAYMPTMETYKQTIEDGNEKVLYYLRPAGMWVEEARQDVTVCAVNDAGDFLWSQPILILQSRYPSQILNDWDGQLKIDENNNYILSAKIGAGKKNNDNTFSGVVMGAWSEPSDKGNTGVDSSFETGSTGLWGFYCGKQSFGFVDTGSAFIGRPGTGRITFDGENGIITSGNWNGKVGVNSDTLRSTNIIIQRGTAGTAIDLQNGHIDAYNFELTSKGIYLNSDPNSEEFSNDYYIFIGQNASTGGIGKDENGITSIASSYFSIDDEFNVSIKALSFNLSDNTHIWLKSSPEVKDDDYYFRIKGDNSEIYLNGNDELYIQAINFELNAYNNNKGIYLNSNPSNGGYYFRIGDTSSEDKSEHSELYFNKDGELYFKILNFDLEAGIDEDNKIYISSSTDDVPLKIGTNFQVAWDGTITAISGVFQGTIYAQNIKFWNGNLVKNSDGYWEVQLDTSKTSLTGGFGIGILPYQGSTQYEYLELNRESGAITNTGQPKIGIQWHIPEAGTIGSGLGLAATEKGKYHTKALRLSSENFHNEIIIAESGMRLTNYEDLSTDSGRLTGSEIYLGPKTFRLGYNAPAPGDTVRSQHQMLFQGHQISLSDNKNEKSYAMEMTCQGYSLEKVNKADYYYSSIYETYIYKYEFINDTQLSDHPLGVFYYTFSQTETQRYWYIHKTPNPAEDKLSSSQDWIILAKGTIENAEIVDFEIVTDIEGYQNYTYNFLKSYIFIDSHIIYKPEYDDKASAANVNDRHYARVYVERNQMYIGATIKLADGTFSYPWSSYNEWAYKQSGSTKTQAEWTTEVWGVQNPHGMHTTYGLFIGGYTANSDNTSIQWTEGKVMLAARSDSLLNLQGAKVNIRGDTYIYYLQYSSDRRLKSAIQPLDNITDQLFDKLQPSSYTLITTGNKAFGFIAQDVQDVCNKIGYDSDYLVGYNAENEHYTLDYNGFIALNTSQIQKLKYRVAQLEQELQELKEKLQ